MWMYILIVLTCVCTCCCVHSDSERRQWITLFLFLINVSWLAFRKQRWPFSLCCLPPDCSHLSPSDQHPSPGITCIITWLAQSAAEARPQKSPCDFMVKSRTRPSGQVVWGGILKIWPVHLSNDSRSQRWSLWTFFDHDEKSSTIIDCLL